MSANELNIVKFQRRLRLSACAPALGWAHSPPAYWGGAEAAADKVSILCITDYELTQSTKAGARESTRADLIEERSQFPQRPTDVATGAPRGGH